MFPKSPCKGCINRTTGFTHESCHENCEAYKAFRAEMDRVHKVIDEGKAVDDYVSHACEKNKRRHR